MPLAYASADLLGLAGRVVLDRDEARHSAALVVRAAHEVTGTLRRDHPHVDALGRRDLLEVDVEAVRERERVTVDEVRLDVGLVDLLLLGVGQQHHHDVGGLHRFAGGQHRETRGFGLRLRLRALAQADDDVDARVLQVQRVRVSLRAVAQDRDLLVGDEAEVGVILVVHVGGHCFLLGDERWSKTAYARLSRGRS